MLLVFRTEGSPQVGWHRLERSLYLATLLRPEIDILFCVNKDKPSIEQLQKKKFDFCLTAALPGLKQRDIGAILFDLGHFAAEDNGLLTWARQNNIKTLQLGQPEGPNQAALFVIDPLADPAYAVLHHKFRHFNRSRRKYRKKIKHVFINLGDTVDYRDLRAVVDRLSRLQLHLKVAPGFSIKKANKKALKRIYPGVGFVGRCESLARAYFEADAAVIAAPYAPYEAAAVGTPALYLCYGGLTEAVADRFADRGAGIKIANPRQALKSGIVETLDRLTLEARTQLGNSAKNLVDARGVYRIIDFLKKNVII
jgi:spore coat polysaccharide biosynthesis predicted glycosyltransferase SpsG